MGKRSWAILAAAMVCGLVGRAALAADLTGKYVGDGLTVQLGSDDSGYHGTITLGTQKFPLGATETNGNFKGYFNAGGTAYNFTAQVVGSQMTLQSGGKVYSLSKDNTPIDAGAAGPVKMPAGYTLVRKSATGQFMSCSKPNAATPRDAAVSATHDFDNFFDSDYKPTRMLEDDHTHAVMMGFGATLHGEPMRGIISARQSDAGITAFVMYVSANSGKDEFQHLLKGDGTEGPTVTGDAPAADIKLTEYRFPDGSATIGLAEGYTTDAQSGGNGGVIKGPAGQEIDLSQTAPIYLPNAQAVLMAQQYRVPGQMPLLVSPMVDPVTAVRVLTPQFSRILQMQGKFAMDVDTLKKVKDMPPVLQGSTSAMATFGMTRSYPDGHREHLQVLAVTTVTPITPECWMYSITSCAAPDATFKQDVPVMMAMLNSEKENAQQIAANTAKWTADRNAWFAGEQKQHNEQVAAGDAQIAANEKASNDRLKIADQFDEIIRGTTTIVDTQTGEQKTVSMGEADGILNGLNDGSPGRFKPLNEVKP